MLLTNHYVLGILLGIRDRIFMRTCKIPFLKPFFKKFILLKYSWFVVIQSLSCIWLCCNPIDCILPDSFVHGISQARILEWVAISFSRWSQPRDQTHIFCIAGRFFTSEPPGKTIVDLQRCVDFCKTAVIQFYIYICTYIHIHTLVFILFSIMIYHRIPNTVSCIW